MLLTAMFLGTAAYIGEHYVKEPAEGFLASEIGSTYSGMYVNADEIGFEGERKL